MAWLWNSWEEYVDVVHPVALDSPQRVRLSQRESWFEAEHSLYKAIHDLEEKSQALAMASQKLGEKIYADAQAKNAQGAAPQPEAAGHAAPEKEEGNVVDAEYTEVKDKKSA